MPYARVPLDTGRGMWCPGARAVDAWGLPGVTPGNE